MIEQATLQTLLMIFQTLSIMVGVIYYITSLRNQSRSRQIQIINASSTANIDFEFMNWEIKDFNTFMSKHGPEADPEGYKSFMMWFNVLEQRGVYVREGLLDIRLVCLMSGGTIKESWEMYFGIFEEWRTRYNRPRDWIEGEYLYNQVLEYHKKHPEIAT